MLLQWFSYALYSLFVTKALHSLQRIVHNAWQRDPAHRAGSHITALVGLETRRDHATYDWHGLKRGGTTRGGYIIFQYTLDGFGHYHDHAGTRRVGAGQAFTAIVPSDHRYYLPAESDGWTFFWLLFYHPYIVERMARVQERAGAVWAIAPDQPLAQRAARIFERIAGRQYADDLALEHALFDFLFDYERFAEDLLHPKPAREGLLTFVRRYVQTHLDEPVDVAKLAALKEMSRSHFTHEFRRKTGLTPAAFIADVRLDEVTRRLISTNDKLDAIAAATGFADANHLCKVFRRRYALTPGDYRRQVRG